MKNWIRKSLLSLASVILLSNCGGAGQADSGFGAVSSDSGSTTDEVVGGNVENLEIDGGSTQVALNDVGSNEAIVLAIHGYSSSSSTQAFQVDAAESASRFLMHEPTEEDGEEIIDEEQAEVVTEDFHDSLRALEEELDPDSLLSEPSSEARFLKTATTETEQSFKVLSSFSNNAFERVDATLVYENDQVKIYVDNRDYDDSLATAYANLAEKFTSVMDEERTLYGQESDVNGDGKITILHTRVVNGLGQQAQGIVTGFFYAADLHSSDQYPNSNEQEIIYTFVPDPKGNLGPAISKSFAFSNIYPGVLPHEFQHMINFNQHVKINGGNTEKSFLNEALSHLAEDIYSLDENGFMTATGKENPARVAVYLKNISNICFVCGSNLSQRGGSYLFLRYLYEQAELGNLSGAASGADLINRLMDTTLVGVNNIVNAANGEGAEETSFGYLMEKFSLAVYLSNTGMTEDTHYQFTGINLREVQSDNRGTLLNGPAIKQATSFPFTESLAGNSVTFIQIDGSDLSSIGNVIELKMGSSAKFGGSVIRN